MKQKQPPTTVLLIRHGENDWSQSDRLAGRTPDVHLNEYGRRQVEALGQRLAEVNLSAIYASPLERTVETAQAIAQHHSVEVQTRPGLLEVDYGEWTGQAVKQLAKTPLWPVIQLYPSGATFPGGESMAGMQARMVQEINALAASYPGATIAIVGHADPLKAAVAYYLGMPFDMFQRLVVNTASLTTLSFTPLGLHVVGVNDTGHVPPRPDNKKKA